MKNKERVIGIDILKVLAVVLVLTVHFFLRTNYYTTEKSGVSMIFQTIIRNFCMICVPLFMTVTGYLNNEKEYNKKFFRKLLNIIIVWIFYSIIEFFVLGLLQGYSIDIKSFLYSVFSYNGCEYSWYINMFIGLYCLSPLINVSFDKFNNTSKNMILILSILIFICPGIINNIYKGNFFLPDWWVSAYPIAYYILGKYICYKKPKFNKKILILCLLSAQLILSSYNINYAIWDYNLLPIYISVLMIFLIFYDVNIKNKFISNVLKYVSNLSLDIYLASSLIDKLVYPYYSKLFRFEIIGQQKAILFAPIILLIVFFLSLAYGSLRKKLINIR